jgi:uncharacterized protein
MTTIRAILDNYATLCSYCDSFFSSILRLYKSEIRCAPGCHGCCELHSVCAIEAHALTAYLSGLPRRRGKRKRGKHLCALLANRECTAYPARPMICRTHGAALLADTGATVFTSCDLNFTSVSPASLPRSHVFDTAAVTGNLMRLNTAFCIAAGAASLSPKRFTLDQVLRRAIPDSILTVKA